MSQLGEALRRERQRRGEKQRDTARRFEVSQPSYHRWESGVSSPSDEHRYAVAEFLGVTVQELWEMIHHEAPPASLEALQGEVAAIKRDIEDLKVMLQTIVERVQVKP